MDQQEVFLTILGMAAVTYLPRFLPTWWLSHRKLPPAVVAWLTYVPVAVFAAMLVPALVLVDGQVKLGFDNVFLWAGAFTFAVAYRSRSFLGTILSGIGTVAVVRRLLGS